MNKTIMAVGSHADDIEIWAGGTILKYRDLGYRILYVMATNNMSGGWSTSREDGTVDVACPGPVPMMERRKAEAAEAARLVGTYPIHLDHPQRHYNGPDGKSVELRYGCSLPKGVPEDVPSILTAHESQQARKVLTDIIALTDPEWILTHGADHFQVEHIATGMLVAKSYWEAVDRGYQGGLLFWMEGSPDTPPSAKAWDMFVDTSGYMERKRDWMAVHRSQVAAWKTPGSSVCFRDRTWGKMCGCETAEVFMLVNQGRAEMLK